MSRILKIAAGLIVLVGLLLLGLRLSTAGDISSEQLLLKLSDLPAGSHVQVRGPLVPGSQANGFINRDGTDIVKEYISGERVDFGATRRCCMNNLALTWNCTLEVLRATCPTNDWQTAFE